MFPLKTSLVLQVQIFFFKVQVKCMHVFSWKTDPIGKFPPFHRTKMLASVHMTMVQRLLPGPTPKISSITRCGYVPFNWSNEELRWPKKHQQTYGAVITLLIGAFLVDKTIMQQNSFIPVPHTLYDLFCCVSFMETRRRPGPTMLHGPR